MVGANDSSSAEALPRLRRDAKRAHEKTKARSQINKDKRETEAR